MITQKLITVVFNFRNGSWILDNFPSTREQWSILLERNKIVPDDIICLKDDSDNGDFLIKRWYFTQRDEIEEKIRARKEAAELARLKREEEQRYVESDYCKVCASLATKSMHSFVHNIYYHH